MAKCFVSSLHFHEYTATTTTTTFCMLLGSDISLRSFSCSTGFSILSVIRTTVGSLQSLQRFGASWRRTNKNKQPYIHLHVPSISLELPFNFCHYRFVKKQEKAYISLDRRSFQRGSISLYWYYHIREITPSSLAILLPARTHLETLLQPGYASRNMHFLQYFSMLLPIALTVSGQIQGRNIETPANRLARTRLARGSMTVHGTSYKDMLLTEIKTQTRVTLNTSSTELTNKITCKSRLSQLHIGTS